MKKIITLFVLAAITTCGFAQSVAISPSRLYYKCAIGEYKTQEVNITNSSSVKQTFTVSFSDFEPTGIGGKSKFMKPGESPNSCSEWLSASPSFFDLEPGASQKIKILM